MISDPQAASPAQPAPCLCSRAAERPAPARSLAELMAAAKGARILEADAAALALILPFFEQASAVTSGPRALMAESGAYAGLRLAGGPLRPTSRRIQLRIAPTGREILALTPADPERRRPAGLHLFDGCGDLIHRTELAAPGDLATLAGFAAEFAPETPLPAPKLQTRPPRTTSLPAIRQARETWSKIGPHRHLDDAMVEGGRARADHLPHVGAGAARRVDRLILPHLLKHLAERRIPFLRAAIRPGLAQLHAGPLDFAGRDGALLTLRAGESLMALDPEGIAACWLTRCGEGWERVSTLELYDAQGFCLALFSAPPESDLVLKVEWERILASLPEA